MPIDLLVLLLLLKDIVFNKLCSWKSISLYSSIFSYFFLKFFKFTNANNRDLHVPQNLARMCQWPV